MNARELRILKYKRMLEERRGHNYEYWSKKHDELLKNGWEILELRTSGRQWSRVFLREATSSEWYAQEEVKKLRESGHYARIVCGYEQNCQRQKMFTVIFKKKTNCKS